MVRLETLHVQSLTPEREPEWERFVQRHPQGSIFHTLPWKRFLSTYRGYEPHYRMALKGDVVQGVLPLFSVKPLFAPKRLVSMPFCIAGGICADTPEAVQALADSAQTLCRDLNANYVELRHRLAIPGNWTDNTTYTRFHLDLAQGEEAIWSGLRKSMRRAIKKSESHGMTVDLFNNDFDLFFKLYSRDQKRFGTPITGYRYLKWLYETFPEAHSIARVEYQGQTAAMFMVRRYKGEVSEMIGNDRPQFRHLNPNLLLEWTLIRHAIETGQSRYDFGRSVVGSGSYHFKEGWGAIPETMHYQFYSPHGKAPANWSQGSGARGKVAKLWQLLP